jgi:WD40 repeat protein
MNDINIQPVILRGVASRENAYEGYIRALAFSQDGRRLATASGITVRVWDVNSHSAKPDVLSEAILREQASQQSITTLAFSPDGHWLATASRDKTVRLWDVNNLGTGAVLLGQHEGGMIFSPNGRWLATGIGDSTIRLWDLDFDRIEHACAVAGRNFTQDEWLKYFPNEPYRKTCEQWPAEQ